MIEVTGLSKSYGRRRAVSDVTFTVERGRIAGFLGVNGAGKTTTMDILCGCLAADAGVARIAGFDVVEEPLEAKRLLGYLPDVPPLHDEMEVRDFLRYAATLRLTPGESIERHVSDVIERLSLGEVRGRLVGNLSKGFRQRVALAQALVHRPEVLVLDEPTEGLDPAQIAQIRELIRGLAGEHTIILSSHILSEVQHTCDDLVIIHQGCVVARGTVRELMESMEHGSRYRVRVSSGAVALAEAIRAIPGVQSVVAGDDATVDFVVAAGAANEAAERAAGLAVERGCGLREISERGRSLEETFFHWTQGKES